MYIFQTIAFSLELSFYLGMALLLIVNRNNFLQRAEGYMFGSYYRGFVPRNSYDSGLQYEESKWRRAMKILDTIAACCAAIMFIYFSIPYLKDIPQLVTKNLEYTDINIYSEDGVVNDPFESINVNGVDIKFFFIGNLENGKNYRIGYLTNTKRGIYLELADKNIKIPIKNKDISSKNILIYICTIICLIAIYLLLYYSGVYFGYKIFMITTILFYPLCIGYYIYCGISTGEWASSGNLASLALFFGVGSLFIYSIYNILTEPFTGKGTFQQFIACYEIGFIIAIIINLFKLIIR
ncbi:hypothetical protein [Clostridium grantii]|uniref:Uncharacterized protein n=1 Tax=Clostridium grantii DSM 8605 TaxID=1121316 RepID=A0A1M5Y5X4_9CLOT|nr:hypothetical protein [Clostridium grantii]SHI07309.1 hypothetical protein SAMN02745207_04214 [Clostridium grantii DSM 8605]